MENVHTVLLIKIIRIDWERILILGNPTAVGAMHASARSNWQVSTLTRGTTKEVPVKRTTEKFTTDKITLVIYLNTAELGTLVPATGSLLLASLLTPGIVRPAGQLTARYLLVHVSAPTSDQRTLRTGGTGT